MKFTKEQDLIVREARENGLEDEIMAVIANPELTAEQMRRLMMTGLTSGYPLGIGDDGYDPKLERQEFMERYARVRKESDGFLARDRKAYTPEEKAAYRKKEEVEELTRRMERGVKDVLESGRYRAYLDMLRKFHDYSFRNVMLILLQKPDATLVEGFTAWKIKHGRFVKKGETGIRIFAPVTYKKTVERPVVEQDTGLFRRDADGNIVRRKEEMTLVGYKAVSVFDVSQTRGKELPEPVRAQGLTGEYTGFEGMMAALRQASPVPIRFAAVRDGSNGYYDPEKKEIVLCEGMSQAQTVKTAIHEMAHALLHDYDLANPQEARERPDRGTMELQAESVAYVVSGYYGLDTAEYSFPYAANWSRGDPKEIQAYLGLVRDTSEKMIGQIGKGLERQREKEQEAVHAPAQSREREMCL